MMKALVIHSFGGPEVLRYEEVPRPEPNDDQVLIRVVAAALNPVDAAVRQGAMRQRTGEKFPIIIGYDIAGVVEKAGAKVTKLKAGDPVYAYLTLAGGGYAEYAVVDARHALPVPGDLDDVHAAAIPETCFTVYANVFEHGALKPGETLLVHGATSGIGVMAIQMAKAAGARVIATARGADKAAAARELGADIAVDTTAEDFGAIAKEAGGVDVALDMVGAPYLRATLDALNTGGRIVYIASQGGDMLEVPVWALMRKRAVLTGSTLRPRDADEKARLAAEVERVVWPWVADGRLRIVVDRTFPLAQAAQAHAFLESGRHTGKVVLLP